MKEKVNAILHNITSAGYEAYLVGGYPRDTYLGKDTCDYDITTSACPEVLKQIFPDANDEDANYGKLTLDGIEITTYRKEEDYLDCRFPSKVTFVKTLAEDLLRRDFIINTLCMDENGQYIDLLGARKQIDDRKIMAVGDANQKLEQDALRILRAIRFAAILNFILDDKLKEAIIKYKTNIKKLSYYRKKEEIDKILVSDNANYGISLLQEFELGEDLEIEGFDRVNTATSLLGIWAQLTFSSKYEFSNHDKKEIEIIRKLLSEDIFNPFILYTYGHYYCTIAAEIKGLSKEDILVCYQRLPIHHQREIAIGFSELEKIVSKNDIKKVYEDLEKQILSGNLDNSKVFIKKYVMQNYHRRND